LSVTFSLKKIDIHTMSVSVLAMHVACHNNPVTCTNDSVPNRSSMNIESMSIFMECTAIHTQESIVALLAVAPITSTPLFVGTSKVYIDTQNSAAVT